MYQAKLRSLPTPVTSATLPLKSMGIMSVVRCPLSVVISSGFYTNRKFGGAKRQPVLPLAAKVEYHATLRSPNDGSARRGRATRLHVAAARRVADPRRPGDCAARQRIAGAAVE